MNPLKTVVRTWLLNLGLVFGSFIVLFSILEGLSRIFWLRQPTYVVDAKGRPTSMQEEPGHPERGLRPGFRGRLRSGQFDVEIALDSRGFRREIVRGAGFPPPAFRVLILGDSFMFGWGVPEQEIFAARLAESLARRLRRKVIVTNLALPGTGQYVQLQVWQNTAPGSQDLIILGVYATDHSASGNDLVDNLTEAYRLQGASAPRARPARGLRHVGWLRGLRRTLKVHSNLYRFVESRFGALLLAKFSGAFRFEKHPRVFRKAWALEDSLLARFQARARQQQALLILQYVPNLVDAANRSDSVYARLQQIALHHGLLLAPNPIEVFAKKEADFSIDQYYFLIDGHWTAKAHRVCAEAMADFYSRWRERVNVKREE